MSKVALVTGGVRRLGRYISYFLAEEGYDLGIIYNSSSAEELNKTTSFLESKGIKFKLYKCDLRNLGALKQVIDEAGEEFGKIDVLINNAGVIKKVDFEDITPELFDDTLNINVRASLFSTQYCIKYLEKSEKPLVINIASLGGLMNWKGYIPYGTSKAAEIKVTQMLAKTLAPKIRVNAIAPGTIIIEGEETGTPAKAPVDKIPLKAYGSPKDIVEAVRYLINAEYVTGQVIAVEGGRLIS